MTRIRFIVAALAAMLALSIFVFSIEAKPGIIVVEAVSDKDTKLSEVEIENEGLFCGWYTSLEGALELDESFAAFNGYEGRIFGAVLDFDTSYIELVGVQMRTEEPSGMRFLAKLDKVLINTLEDLHADNRKGKNSSFNPANETKIGIGYGMVLDIDVNVDGLLTKTDGKTVNDGMCIPGVYTYAEDDTSITYTATVLGVDTASLADKIAARPYITYADANGYEHTVYYTESGSENGAYATSIYELANLIVADETAAYEDKAAADSLLAAYSGGTYASKSTIKDFNLSSIEGSADGDNAYIELDKSTFAELSSTTQSVANAKRYNDAYYTRTIKVNDNLYLMLFGYGQYGVHLYSSTSTDGVNWTAPVVMYNASQNTYTHLTGALKGTSNAYDKFYAVNADACVLDDGTILCVYSRRPNHGYIYKDYNHLSTIELVRGRVSGTSITWSSPTSIYHGTNWEPEIIKRENGDIEVYWSHIAPMIDIYGYQTEKRSSGIAMMTSSDNGYTWIPSVGVNDKNHFAAKRVFQQYVGDMTIDGASVPFYTGQMPAVVELCDGRLMLACEIEPMAKDGMLISTAFSNADGEWDELAISEEGPESSQRNIFKGAAPTLTRFDSGEVLLTYNAKKSNDKSVLYTRVLNKEGNNIETAAPVDFFGTTENGTSGFWSSSSKADSHTAVISMSYTHNTLSGKRRIFVGQGRLNHTVNAINKNIIADGNLQEWENADEALFVGSASAAQCTFRFACDDEYIYVAIDRTDSSVSVSDFCYIMIADDDSMVRANVSLGNSALPSGVTAGVKSASGGAVYELAFDREQLGFTGESIRVCPGLTDTAADTDDIIDGIDTADKTTWIKVNLCKGF